MDWLINTLVNDISKVAIFLLLFSFVALLFEIFYFRKRRHISQPAPADISSDTLTTGSRIKKRNIIVIGVVLMLLLLPVSLYAVFQQVIVEKEAQVEQIQQIVVGCDQIDILRDNVVSLPSSLLPTDTVSFVGYCYIEGAGSQETISKSRFVLSTPTGTLSPVEYLAFTATEKNTGTRRYFKATYPNVKLAGAGAYSVQVWGYNNQTGLSNTPFVRSFTVTAAGLVVTPTAPPSVQAAPTCSSLSSIPLTGPAPLTASLTGSGSDTGGQVVAFEFTFGDGAKQTVNKNVGASGSASASHVYQTAGTYSATLRVKDNNGNFSAPSELCSVQIAVATSTATTSASLKAQPTKTITPTPTTIKLPEAGVSLPMVGFISAGLLFLTFGLLLAF